MPSTPKPQLWNRRYQLSIECLGSRFLGLITRIWLHCASLSCLLGSGWPRQYQFIDANAAVYSEHELASRLHLWVLFEIGFFAEPGALVDSKYLCF